MFCDVVNPGGWEEGSGSAKEMDGLTAYLPPSICEQLELKSNPFVGSSSLTILNDSGTSFNEIADIIEKEL